MTSVRPSDWRIMSPASSEPNSPEHLRKRLIMPIPAQSGPRRASTQLQDPLMRSWEPPGSAIAYLGARLHLCAADMRDGLPLNGNDPAKRLLDSLCFGSLIL